MFRKLVWSVLNVQKVDRSVCGIRGMNNSSLQNNIFNTVVCIAPSVFMERLRTFHCGLPRRKAEDRREMLASLPAKDEGTEGERSVDIDSLIKR